VAEEGQFESVDPFGAQRDGGADDQAAADPQPVAGLVPTRRAQALSSRDPRVLRSAHYTREDWVELGRLAGEQEASDRLETGNERLQRIARAMAYYAWEWDGKPLGYGNRYQREFGVGSIALHDALRSRGADWKRADKR
jgi:hypothetical protein